MKNKSVFNDFLKYVSLNILGQAAFSCYISRHFFVSANLGLNGITALNLAFPIFCLINGTGLMIGMGGGTRYSIVKSRGNHGSHDRRKSLQCCTRLSLYFPSPHGNIRSNFCYRAGSCHQYGRLIILFHPEKNRFCVVNALPKATNMFEILSSGVPSFVTEVTSGIVMLVFNSIILKLEGNTGVAAFAVITVLSLVIVAIYTRLSQGIQPIISLNHGFDKPSNVKSILKYALITVFILSGVIYTIIFWGASQLVSIFNSENNHVLQTLAVAGLRLYFCAWPFIGFNIVTATYFTSMEQPHPAQIILLLRGFWVLIPMAFLLSALLKMTGVWCAYPLTEFIVAWVGVIFYISSIKRKERLK